MLRSNPASMACSSRNPGNCGMMSGLREEAGGARSAGKAAQSRSKAESDFPQEGLHGLSLDPAVSQLDHLAPTTSPTENRFNTYTQIGQFPSPSHHFLVNYLVGPGLPGDLALATSWDLVESVSSCRSLLSWRPSGQGRVGG